jgi:hypothetical protein
MAYPEVKILIYKKHDGLATLENKKSLVFYQNMMVLFLKQERSLAVSAKRPSFCKNEGFALFYISFDHIQDLLGMTLPTQTEGNTTGNSKHHNYPAEQVLQESCCNVQLR